MTLSVGILAMIAVTVGGTLAVAVLYAVITRGRDWRQELFSVRVLPFVLMGLAAGAATLAIGYYAKLSADESLRLSVADIESDCDDQLTLLLHTDATEFVNRYAKSKNLTHDEIRKLSEYCGIDEFTLVGADGRIVDTTDPAAKAGDFFFVDEAVHGPYRELMDGRRLTVRQRFRQSATCSTRALKYFGMALEDGRFLQIGFLWETFEREFVRFFLPIFEERIVGQSGFCVVLNDRDLVDVTVPRHADSKAKTAAEIGFTKENLSEPLGRVFRARLFGTQYRCMAYPETVAGRRIYAVVPLSEGQGPAMALALGVAIIIFAAYLVFRLIMRKLRMQQAKIDALRAEEERRRAEDLALARSIQRAELRTDGAEGEGYRIATQMKAAREVGGDFYDYYELPDGRLVVTIADVSGKGVPAAFFMMKSRMVLKSSVYTCLAGGTRPVGAADDTEAVPPLADAIARANARLAGKNPAEMFVTAWIGVYDRKTGMLDYVSAGHNDAVRVKKVEKVEEVEEVEEVRVEEVEWVRAPRCSALGVFERAKYRAASMKLSPGDRIFLYTDGVTEAMNEAGELFGNERLVATLAADAEVGHPQGGTHSVASEPGTLIPSVSAAIDNFVGDAEQSDDITMLELQIAF